MKYFNSIKELDSICLANFTKEEIKAGPKN